MKTITLTQPWASLVAIGVKQIETRSWQTSYRGPLAIHAAKGFPKWAKELCYTEPFKSVLALNVRENMAGQFYLSHVINNLPTGCIVATCELTGIYSTNSNILSFESNDISISSKTGVSVGAHKLFQLPPAEPELSFGDYSPGRFAWVLENIQPLLLPVPAKGALSLWEWDKDGGPA